MVASQLARSGDASHSDYVRSHAPGGSLPRRWRLHDRAVLRRSIDGQRSSWRYHDSTGAQGERARLDALWMERHALQRLDRLDRHRFGERRDAPATAGRDRWHRRRIRDLPARRPGERSRARCFLRDDDVRQDTGGRCGRWQHSLAIHATGLQLVRRLIPHNDVDASRRSRPPVHLRRRTRWIHSEARGERWTCGVEYIDYNLADSREDRVATQL